MRANFHYTLAVAKAWSAQVWPIGTGAWRGRSIWSIVLVPTFAFFATLAVAQTTDGNAPLRPGEAFVTRFSGTKAAEGIDGNKVRVINPDGTVGSVIDLRAPQQLPQGQHWIDEPQRTPLKAKDVGQVFGVALDNASPPNIFVTATSAFGLHLTPGTSNWMAGMWGRDGDPGTIYKLDRDNGYRPTVFATVALDGRRNTGAALGNIAFDRANNQFLVSDLETGMLHRIRASDGRDLGRYDHGTQGRPKFFDVPRREGNSLPPLMFDPSSRAQIRDCAAGQFDRNPACWNIAASGRLVWGIGVRYDAGQNQSRVFYAVWSGPAFANVTWASERDDAKRNAVWSVGLGPDGVFDPADVRREFELPDFFVKPEDVARLGHSSPVSDITFAECGERPVMLIAERGGIRNLGLTSDNAFSTPHAARTLRYELDVTGAWRPVGRYDVGFYDRKSEGAPYIRANCSGGAAFGPGYNPETWIADLNRKDEFVWISGHGLCSPDGPCRLPGRGEAVAEASQTDNAAQSAAVREAVAGSGEDAGPDDSQVHGVQGMLEKAFEEVAPIAAFAPYPKDTDAYPPTGPAQAYLIDTDINVDAAGGVIEEELTRNDATRIGDVVIYQPCQARPAGMTVPATFLMPPLGLGVAPPDYVGHPMESSHARVASHGQFSSHSRFGSHNPYWSHSRFGSHNQSWSHSREGSHSQFWSHNRLASHGRVRSHSRLASHGTVLSHYRLGSHNQRLSHSRLGSHNATLSHSLGGSHNQRVSHQRLASHNLRLSHSRLSSHTSSLSHSLKGSHNLALSHNQQKSHSTVVSSGTTHRVALSRGDNHGVVQSKGTTHAVVQSRGTTHAVVQSRGTTHAVVQSKGTTHSTAASSAVKPRVPPIVSRPVNKTPVPRKKVEVKAPPKNIGRRVHSVAQSTVVRNKQN